MASHALPHAGSPDRRLSLGLLLAITVIGLVCAFGPLWMVRVGLLVALVGAAVSVWFAFREVKNLQVIHRAELKAVRDAAKDAASTHHRESMDVIESFTARTRAHGEQLAALRAQLAAGQEELSTLQGRLVSTTAESDRRAARVAELEQQLAGRQAQLTALELRIAELTAGPEAEVVALPGRTVPTAAELWSEGTLPAHVDLSVVNLPVQERKRA